MLDNLSPVKREDSAYRRGLVLGVTMAEIMVLVLFALLLALGVAMAERERVITEHARRIDELTVLEREVAELLKNDPSGVTVSDVIRRIERSQREMAALQERLSKVEKELAAQHQDVKIEREQAAQTIAMRDREISELKALTASGAAIEDIISELKRQGAEAPTAQDVVSKLNEFQKLTKEAETYRGQIAQLSRHIKETGRGNEFPSCWVTGDGKTESIFSLLISSGGVAVHSRKLPHREGDLRSLPLKDVSYETVLSLGDFQRQLRPLYQWSVEQQCRFYVLIYSADERAPIQLVNAVNGFFYPDSRIQYRPGGL